MIALLLVAAAAAEQPRLAVLEFDVAQGVDVDRIYFSDKVRGAVEEHAPSLFVMTRESTDAILKGYGKSLADCGGECEVEVGRKLGADYVVSGRLTKVGTRLALTLRMHGTQDGRLVKTAEALGKDVDALVDATDAAVVKLVKALEQPAAPPQPVAGQVRVEPKSGLEFVYMPGGAFHVGSEPEWEPWATDEKPFVPVTLQPFWIGKTEVTAAAYDRCVKAGGCTAAPSGRGCTYATLPDHPINCVTVEQAMAFCAWAGGRLPTNDEWEFAAKSGEARVYPWGNEPLDATRANFCDKRCHEVYPDKPFDGAADDGFGLTAPVGHYPRGATKWGLLDMAGNVAEWIATRHNRGGSLANGAFDLRNARKLHWGELGNEAPDLGMRCALER